LRREIGNGLSDGFAESLRDGGEVFLEDAHYEEVGSGEDAADEGRHRGLVLFEEGQNEGFDDLFDRGMGAGLIEHVEAAAVDGFDSPLDDGIHQAVFGLEVVVDGGEVYSSGGGDVAEGGGFETVLSKEVFGGIEDSRFGICTLFNHTYVLIIRLNVTIRQDGKDRRVYTFRAGNLGPRLFISRRTL
jgi:hypothetical protein